MPVEMGMWRIDGDQPRRLSTAKLPTEATLEEYLERDPSLLGEKLLVIGRQVRTPYGKFIDLLAMDGDGNLHVLELKRDKTPRDVVAQVLDYGSWVSTLKREKVIELANGHLGDVAFETAFADLFGDQIPEELNGDVRLTVIAAELDDSSERIVTYLQQQFQVPINVVFFSYLEDDGRRYLTRSWLVSPTAIESGASAPARRGKRAEWNGRDWFVSFGDGMGRSWDDARTYGFVSAGGGAWYSRTLRSLPVGARVNVHLPGPGYVGVGETIGEAQRFDEAQVLIGDKWVPLADQTMHTPYRHGDPVTEESAEYVVPVRWAVAVPKAEAYWVKGMFANQNSACKLRDSFTLDRLAEHFDLDD